MNKYLKYGLLAAGGTGVLLAGSVAYIAATFDPNAYKPQIIQAVKESKQRTLRLDGDIKLTFFPSVGADLGKVSLSERNSDKEFAALDSAHVSLALLPLLSKRAVVDEVSVGGLKVVLVKYKDGKSNIDDLLDGGEEKAGKEAGGPPVDFDVAAVRVEGAELTYRDEGSHAEYALKGLNFHTGRVAVGVPVPVDFSARIQSGQPKLDIAAQAKTTLTFDLGKRSFALDGLDLQAHGSALDISGLNIQAGGDAGANLTEQEFFAKRLAVTASGTKGQESFEAKLEAPALKLAGENFSGDKLRLDVKLAGTDRHVVASLVMAEPGGTRQFFKSSLIALNVDVKQPEQAFEVKLASPAAGNLDIGQFNLPELKVAVHATGEKLPNKSISSEMKGSVQVDVDRKSVQARLAGGLLQSQVRAKLAVNGFSRPTIRFDVDMDQFDADLYMPKKPAGEAQKDGAAAEQPIDLSALKELKLEGSLRMGALKAANVKVSQLRVDVKARDGMLSLNPLSAKLYGGSMDGNVTLNAAQAVPEFSVSEKLTGINIAPLLKDAAGFDMLEGKGSVTLNLNTRGNVVSALKKGLGGVMSLSLADGAVKGINVARTIRGAGNLFGKQALTQDANKDEKTDFSELKASFRVNNGVAHNEDLSLKSPLLRLGGNGDIDIGNDRIDYLAKATLAGTLEGQGGKSNVSGLTVPVRLSGPYTSLKYTLDFGAMVGGAVKQKVEAKKEEVKQQMKDQLKEGLKGLFR